MKDLHLLNYLEDFISEERKARFIDVLEARTNYITVAVEDLFKMHNTSAVIRSCEVFGIQEAHVIEDKYSQQLDKKIALGAQKWVDVIRHDSSKNCIQQLRNEGYKIIATTPHKNDCSLADFKIDEKVALFFGTEKDGLSAEVLNNADGFLKIEMVGFTESLNISVSAAIILRDLTIRLRELDVNWQLTTQEKIEKRLDWTRKSIKSIDDILTRYDAMK
jgi:tRNA (guanosine-2'-O-)-methyltransferase